MIMRRLILTSLLFILITHLVTAPTMDFRLKMARLRYLTEYVNRLCLEWEFSRFINDLGYRESENNWMSINRIGCFGEWQFSESTLRYLGYKNITLKKFRANPEIFPRELQVQALKGLIRVNLAHLRNHQHYIGDTIKGVVITKSGMIAAAHLGGAGTLKRYLNTKGKINRKDILGTSIHDYLKRFSGYDLEEAPIVNFRPLSLNETGSKP